MSLGLGVLRLGSDAFWRMTPRELAAAAASLDGDAGAMPFARNDLTRLMAAFPDQSG